MRTREGEKKQIVLVLALEGHLFCLSSTSPSQILKTKVPAAWETGTAQGVSPWAGQ